MSTITRRSMLKWQWRNGKLKKKPVFCTDPRVAIFLADPYDDDGIHPTKGRRWKSRHGKRSNT